MVAHVILIVESDKHAGKLFKSCIEQGGYRAVTANNIEDALNLTRMWDPDLVVVDQSLSNHGADRLIEDLVRQPAGRPRIVLTTFETPRPTSALAAHADAVIAKPLSRERLTSLVGLLLEDQSGFIPVPAAEGMRRNLNPATAARPSDLLRQIG
jgi:CheY-like chemotaxis protein